MSIVRSKLWTWGRGPLRACRDSTKPDSAGRREGQPSNDVAPDQVRAVDGPNSGAYGSESRTPLPTDGGVSQLADLTPAEIAAADQYIRELRRSGAARVSSGRENSIQTRPAHSRLSVSLPQSDAELPVDTRSEAGFI